MNDIPWPGPAADGSRAPHGSEADQPVPKPGRRFPPLVQISAIVAVACVLAAVLFVLPAAVKPASTAVETAAPPDGAFKPTDQQWAGLKVQRVLRSDFAPSVSTEGRIAIDDDLNTPLFSPYSGRVTRVFAHAGDVVAAGTPLFAVQSTELAQAQNDMVSALATLRTAHAQLELATINERRQHTLYLGHGAAQRDWQQSLVDLATARGGLSTAAIAVSAVRNRLNILGLSHTDIAGIEATANPEHVSADTIVRAPIAGTVTQRQISPGQNIVGSVASQGTAQAVFTIGNLGRVWMVANASEADAPRFHVGDLAQVSVPAYPGRSFQAQVTYVAPVIDPSTHRLLVRAAVANADGALKPDMLAQFEIVTGVSSASLAVPENAVVYEGADAHVWVADPAHHTLAIRPVTAGPENHGLVEILRGLNENESVVTSGAVFIDRTLSDS